MTDHEPHFFETMRHFEQWMEVNHARTNQLVVGFKRKATGKPSITWKESVDVALCFGWIDGVRRGLDDESYTIRFTPRRKGSIWSRVNIARAEELERLGRMRADGQAAFAARSEEKSRIYSYEREQAALPPKFVELFQEHAQAWMFFEAQPPSYRRPAIWWVVSAKREETRLRRLQVLIECSVAGKRLNMLSK